LIGNWTRKLDAKTISPIKTDKVTNNLFTM